jgi:predicted ATPase/DNA-binding NarL/FixJ family response regulator
LGSRAGRVIVALTETAASDTQIADSDTQTRADIYEQHGDDRRTARISTPVCGGYPQAIPTPRYGEAMEADWGPGQRGQSGRVVGGATDGSLFVGRERLLNEITTQFEEGARVVVLLGTGGVGKTRIADEYTQSPAVQEAWPGGVWRVDLTNSSASGPELLAVEMLDALSFADLSKRNKVEVLAEHLRDAHALIMIDNVERITTAAALLLGMLIRKTVHVRFLVTSRMPLNLRQERVLPVPPLATPPVDHDPVDGMTYEAPRLFADRCAAIGRPIKPEHYPLVLQLCHDIDGLPLAIEIAARRTRMLTLAMIVERLGTVLADPTGRFDVLVNQDPSAAPNHVTIEAVVRWSYDLCDTATQLLWQRVAVFAGPFTIDDAVQVCADAPTDECADTPLRAEQIEPLLAELVDQSILIADTSGDTLRLRMLETLRAFGASRMSPDALTTSRRRHLEHYLSIVRAAAEQWYSPDEVTVLHSMWRLMPNIRAAVDFAVAEPGQSEIGLGMWVALVSTRSLFLAGTRYEGRYQMRRFWGAPDGEAPRSGGEYLPEGPASPLRVDALALACWIALCQGDQESAVMLLDAAQAMVGQLGLRQWPPTLTYAHASYRLLALAEPDAIPLLVEAADQFGAAGAAGPRQMALLFAGIGGAFVGTAEQSRTHTAAALADAVAHGAPWAITWARWAAALGEMINGDAGKALEDFWSIAGEQATLADMWGFTWALLAAGWAGVRAAVAVLSDPAAAQDHRAAREALAQAAYTMGAARVMRRRAGVDIDGLTPFAAVQDATLAMAREALGDGEFRRAYDEGAALHYTKALALPADHRTPLPDGGRPAGDPLAALTDAELGVVALVAQGKSNDEIARTRVCSKRTVESHISAAMRKLGITAKTGGRTALAMLYRDARQA